MFYGLQQICVDVITSGLIFAGVALGFVLILRGTGFFNVAYGALFVGAGYIFAVLYTMVGLPLIFSVTATSVSMAAIFAVLDMGFRWIGETRQHSVVDRAMVASVGLALIVENACGWAFGTDVKSVSTTPISVGFVVPTFTLVIGMTLLASSIYFAWRETSRKLVLAALIIIVCLIVLASIGGQSSILPHDRLILASISLASLLSISILGLSPLGVRWRAYLSSPTTARLLGYRVELYRLYCVLAGGAVTGLLSSVYVKNSGIRPDESWRLLIGAAFVALLSRRMSTPLLILSGIAYSIASYSSVLVFSSAWKDAVTFTLLFVLLILKPRQFDAETNPIEA